MTPVIPHALVAAALVWAGVFADVQAGRQPPALALKSMQGRDTFQFYCASCHGCDARGRGPVAPALVSAPADLTRLEAEGRGVFPRDRVRAVLSGKGRPLPSHGSSEMPVWGPIFRALDSRAGYDDLRIANLVSYLESIQGKPPAACGGAGGGPDRSEAAPWR